MNRSPTETRNPAITCRGKKTNVMLPKCDMTESSFNAKCRFAGIERNLRRNPRYVILRYYDLSEPACKCGSPKPSQNFGNIFLENPVPGIEIAHHTTPQAANHAEILPDAADGALA